MEGGPNTIHTALGGARNGVPVLVVMGSGRAADLIASAYKETSSEE